VPLDRQGPKRARGSKLPPLRNGKFAQAAAVPFEHGKVHQKRSQIIGSGDRRIVDKVEDDAVDDDHQRQGRNQAGIDASRPLDQECSKAI
jgi:hypothetical protein